MYKSAHAPTIKSTLGEFFVKTFQNDPYKVFTSEEIKQAIQDLDIPLSKNLSAVLQREFADAIVYKEEDKKHVYALNPEWGVDGLRDAVNDYRRNKGLPLLESPNSEGSSREILR